MDINDTSENGLLVNVLYGLYFAISNVVVDIHEIHDSVNNLMPRCNYKIY